MSTFIYLDNNSTTPIDPTVLEEMLPFYTTMYGNAASNHEFGIEVNQAVKDARAAIADLVGAEYREIVFTSGATEAINMAIRGTMKMNITRGKHLIVSETEHPAVIDTCRYLENEGYEITYLPVKTDGLVAEASLASALRPDTVLVCIMLVNNETGVIQPISNLSNIAHQNGSFFLTDATQAFGKAEIDVDKLGIDLMPFSAHKFYGPKGIGALFIRSRRPFKVKLEPLVFGGGHEGGYRSGTLNVPAIIGMSKAAQLAYSQLDNERNRIRQLRDRLETELLKIENSFVNGHPQERIYNTCNICFRGTDASAIMIGLKDVIISNGSACSSSKIEPSHVLQAMGLSESDSYSSLRISLGRFTTAEDITIAVSRITEEIRKLRATMTAC